MKWHPPASGSAYGQPLPRWGQRAGWWVAFLEDQARPGEDTPAGLRTFAIAALSGAVAALLPVPLLLPALTLATAALTVAAYRRGSMADPGLTSEFALILTVLLGALTVSAAELAAGIAAVVVGLLHAKAHMHRLVRETLSQDDANDALLLGIAALVIWPLLPDRYLGPFKAWNPHRLWLVVLLVMATGAVGRACSRWLGERVSLPLVAFFGGFASSLATIGAMAAMAGNTPQRARASLAAALFSSVATFVQMMLVLAATSLVTWRALILPLTAGPAGHAGICEFLALALLEGARPGDTGIPRVKAVRLARSGHIRDARRGAAARRRGGRGMARRGRADRH